MIKFLLSIFLFLSTFLTFGGLVLRDTYIVVSDEKSTDVPEGSCRVHGTIYSGSGVIQNALISNLDRSRSGMSDEKGMYSFLLSNSDTSIFFFKEGFNELVIWSYSFKSGHDVQIDFYANDNVEIQCVSKPVIYLYSEEDMVVSIYPDFKGELSCTYPEMNEQWNISLECDEIIDRNTSKTYPYLFWDGEMTNLDFNQANEKAEGELLHKSQVVDYLEKSLTAIGFNQKEKTDFITFWGPKMAKKEYSFVQLLEDDQVDEKIGGLMISPEPTNLKRVYMLFKTFDKLPDIDSRPQQFSKTKRDGFTVLEWGGTEINQTKIIL